MSNRRRSQIERNRRIHTSASSLPLESWDDLNEDEQAIVQSVKSNVLEVYRNKSEHLNAQKAPFGLGWQLAAGCAVILFGLFWMVRPQALDIPSLQFEGKLSVRSNPSGTTQKKHVQLALEHSAHIQDPQGWKLRSLTNSQLSIRRMTPHNSHIRLKRGIVRIHVTPKTMKQFVVECRQLQVVVKGTLFSVWSGRNWSRIEVTRGHVELRRKGKVFMHLYKGQGVRISEQYKSLEPYPVPHTKRPWFSKIEWMGAHNARRLYAYTLDLLEPKLLSRITQMRILESSVHALSGAKRWHEVSKLWMRLYRLQPKGKGAQAALFQAAQTCRLQTPMPYTSCAQHYQLFRTQFPRGMKTFREMSVYWQGMLLFQHSNQKTKGRQILRAYIHQFPHGIYSQRVRNILGHKD